MPQRGLLGRVPGDDKPLPVGACDASFRGLTELTGGSQGPQRFCEGTQPLPPAPPLTRATPVRPGPQFRSQ